MLHTDVARPLGSPYGTPVATYGKPGDVCATPGCGTLLRRTNEYDRCEHCLALGHKARRRSRSRGEDEAAHALAPAERPRPSERPALRYRGRCPQCDQTFRSVHPGARYCSEQCRTAAYRARKKREEHVESPETTTIPVDLCPVCGGAVVQTPIGRRRVYCSDECKKAAKHAREGVEEAVADACERAADNIDAPGTHREPTPDASPDPVPAAAIPPFAGVYHAVDPEVEALTTGIRLIGTLDETARVRVLTYLADRFVP